MLVSLPRSTRWVLAIGVAAIAILALELSYSAMPNLHEVKSAIAKIQRPHKGSSATLPQTLDDADPRVIFQVFDTANNTDLNASADPPCQALRRADDVLVVLRTGASEIQDKVPVKLETTFKCYPHTLMFSDYEETFEGHKVYNVLEDIDPHIIEENEDFEYYRRLQHYGRISLDQAELSGKISDEGDPGLGKGDNLGWRLDKWKFLPMMNMTLNLEPNRKWYVFVEPDSYLVWSNLLQWLPTLDHTKPLYYGAEVAIGDDVFAHGGSIWVLSKPALEAVAKNYVENTEKWNELLWWEYWAGDCILGRALYESGVPLTNTWPMLQGGNPSLMDFDSEDLWCAPALSYHHVRDDEVASLWQLEQDYIRAVRGLTTQQDLSSLADKDRPRLLHKDIFNLLVKPNLTSERLDWDNHADMLMEETESSTMDECRELCEYNDGCKLYSIGPYGCSVSFEMKLGQPRDGVRSGWLIDRISHWLDEIGNCNERDGWSVS